MLYNYVLEFELTEDLTEAQRTQTLAALINHPTDEGFTCLHFAAYHGNYALIRFLLDTCHADLNLKNAFGASVLHIAAQGDQELSLYCFVVKCGMDVNMLDAR